MQRSNQLCSLVLILGLASLCSIEVAAAELYKLVNRGALQQRIAALYTAEESNNWRAFYEIVSPEIRKDSTFEDFLKDSVHRHFKMVSWKVNRIRGGERDPEYPPQVTSGAEVLMDVSIANSDGHHEKVEDQTDYWVLLDGVWYWAWRGWPYD